MYESAIYSIDDPLNKEIRFMLAPTNLDQLILPFFQTVINFPSADVVQCEFIPPMAPAACDTSSVTAIRRFLPKHNSPRCSRTQDL